MNCQEIDDRLDDYVDGALGAPAASSSPSTHASRRSSSSWQVMIRVPP